MTENRMNVKRYSKYFMAAACALMMCMMLGGCMNTGAGGTNDAQNSTPPQNTMQADDWNNGNMNNGGMSNGGMNNGNMNSGIGGMNGSDAANVPPVFDWLNMGRGIEDKIGMISEIESCRIVVVDDTALAGVKFASQYQGELTQRIRDMVAGEIMAADANIRTVAVTAEAEDVQKINQIADQIASGTPAENFKSEIDAIVRNVTTLQ